MIATPYILWTLSTPPPELPGNTAPIIHIPFIEIIPQEQAVDPIKLADCESVVITSPAAIGPISAHLPLLAGKPFYAVGPTTKARLEAAGVTNIAIPHVATGAALVELLGETPPQLNVFFPRGNLGGKTILAYLEAAGIPYYSPVVYHTAGRPVDSILQQLPAGADPLAAALGSPSGVAVWAQVNRARPLHCPIATIGPATTQACQGAGLEVWLEGSGEVRGLIQRMADHLHEIV